MSWWKRGEELGEQAPAGVRYTDTVPERVIETTSLWALREVSSVPNEPSVGVAAVPVAGQLRPRRARGRAGGAERLEIERGGPADHLLGLARSAHHVPDHRAGEELEVVDRRRDSRARTGRCRGCHAPMKSWPPWYSFAATSSARISPVAGAKKSIVLPSSVPNAG